MRMKSYFANSVQEAIDQAREDLGLDVMLISSSKTDSDLKELGAYEVVFGLPRQEPGRLGSTGEAAAEVVTETAPGDRVLRELAELRDQMEMLRLSISRSATSHGVKQFTPELTRLFDRLLDVGFSVELARELTEAVSGRIEPYRQKPVRVIREHREVFARDLYDALIAEEIETRFQALPSLGAPGKSPNVVLFVGPPGAGKTTTLAKLAFQFGAKARRPLHLASADTLRIGGSDQLQTYARILGARFDTAETFPALLALVGAAGANALTLIDTPGFAASEPEQLAELAALVQGTDIEIQLVMPGALALRTAERVWKRFAGFHPAKLLLTHLDEVESAAVPVEFGMRSGLPLSFFGVGQQVPEDICDARKPELIEKLLPARKAAPVAA